MTFFFLRLYNLILLCYKTRAPVPLQTHNTLRSPRGQLVLDMHAQLGPPQMSSAAAPDVVGARHAAVVPCQRAIDRKSVHPHVPQLARYDSALQLLKRALVRHVDVHAAAYHLHHYADRVMGKWTHATGVHYLRHVGVATRADDASYGSYRAYGAASSNSTLERHASARHNDVHARVIGATWTDMPHANDVHGWK